MACEAVDLKKGYTYCHLNKIEINATVNIMHTVIVKVCFDLTFSNSKIVLSSLRRLMN